MTATTSPRSRHERPDREPPRRCPHHHSGARPHRGARPWGSALFGVSVLVVALLPVVQPVLLQQVVDRLTGTTAGGVLLLAIGYALTVALPALLNPAQDTFGANLEDRVVGEVDRRLIAASRRLVDLTLIERPALQDQVRLHRDIGRMLPSFFFFGRSALGAGVTIIGLLVVLARLHPLVPVALGLAVIPQLVVEKRMRALRYAAMRDRAPAAREMDYCARLATEPEGAKEVRVFGIGAFLLGRFQRRFADAYGEINRIRIRHLWLAAAFSAVHVFGLVGGFTYVAWQADNGRLTAGDVALYLNAVIQFELALFMLPMGLGALFELRLHAGRLFEFTDSAGPGIEITPVPTARAAPSAFERGIELREVSFGYPEGEHAVLSDVNLSLPAGRITALVGENGAGKSTLVKLLTRMYDPDAGQLLLDDRPFAAYDLDSLRARIGVVYQDFARFSMTLADNIATGDVAASTPDLDRAMRLAGADAVAADLTRGLDTMLTRRFEGGVELSGGQWQKVATARGFLRDAAFVILDEPTAALDADAERALFDRFRRLMTGRTALLISHRFSTVRMADRIAVLERGRIIETGTHADLVAAGGRYAELFEMQAGRYR